MDGCVNAKVKVLKVYLHECKNLGKSLHEWNVSRGRVASIQEVCKNSCMKGFSGTVACNRWLNKCKGPRWISVWTQVTRGRVRMMKKGHRREECLHEYQRKRNSNMTKERLHEYLENTREQERRLQEGQQNTVKSHNCRENRGVVAWQEIEGMVSWLQRD